ncbi:MAG: urease accessory protein UreD, partial [Nitrosopumilaceae archaeon]|nr:urease accessory protein UreD [Nitrosopumilaceae archaeon]
MCSLKSLQRRGNKMDTKELIDIPDEFAQYEIRQADPTGKSGVIRLVLENDHDKNKTVIKEQYSQAPLYTQRALYYDTANPSMAYLFLISSSGGILQDDRYQVDVLLQNGAMANITTQGATRIYKMDSGFAVQDMNITVGDGCYLELVPDQIIPYKNSRYCQRVNITISDDATLVYSELVTPGRVAMGELFDYDICYLRTVVRDKSDKLKLIDTSMLRPKEQNLQAMG